MQVLRNSKESLMAVLEAFVYDPLINWRLMQTEVEARRVDGSLFLDCVQIAILTCCLQTRRQTPNAQLSWQR